VTSSTIENSFRISPPSIDWTLSQSLRLAVVAPDELERIEAQANAEVAKDLPFVRREVSPIEAERLFSSIGEKFKVEIIQDVVAKGAKTLSLYSHGDWVDFCLGPHGPSTGKIGVIKLLSSSGAYWRGDHRNPMLQRIYGTAFFDKVLGSPCFLIQIGGLRNERTRRLLILGRSLREGREGARGVAKSRASPRSRRSNFRG
jgi:hypothetical protein